ncbi:helix-turn-helix transcriptional regulator [Mesorhizobium loti]
MRKLVGQNARRIRRRSSLAEISSFSQQYISGPEKGKRSPTIVTLYKLAQALRATSIWCDLTDQD